MNRTGIRIAQRAGTITLGGNTIDGFAQAIVDGAPSPVPAEQSIQVMAILDGIYRSQKSGREVKISY